MYVAIEEYKSTPVSKMASKEHQYGVGNISGNIGNWFCDFSSQCNALFVLYCGLRSYQLCINIKGTIQPQRDAFCHIDGCLHNHIQLLFPSIFSNSVLFIIWNIFRHTAVTFLPCA